MRVDHLTQAAVRHTLHCLLGCSIGEVLGMVLTTALDWSNTASVAVSVLLAFFFGYLLTFWSIYRKGIAVKEAMHTAVATDTASIISMETIDNLFILLVPGAISAALDSWLFWVSLGLSLIVAFIMTVPINRWLIARNPHEHMGH